MAISFDFCSLDAVEELQSFIRDHWSARHALASSRRLMDWQHRDDANGRYNALLARHDDQGIVGMLGFIPTSRYDAALADGNETAWLTTWKVRDDYAHGLGLMLLRSLTARLRPDWIGTVGFNPATRGIYTALGYKVGMLARHYLLNEDLAGRTLVSCPSPLPAAPAATGTTLLRPLPAEAFWPMTEGLGLDESDQVPRKTRAYLYNRYVKHPFYDYRLFLAAEGGAGVILVLRACRHDGAVALRMVDLLGAPAVLAGCGPSIRRLLDAFGAEYLDFYCSGLADELAAAGFRLLRPEDGLVLPGHFEPFERRNVDMLYCLHGRGGRTVVCKGDADQDRPNRLEGAPS